MLVLIEMQRYYRLGAVQIATQTHCRSCAAAMPSISWVRRRLRRILEDVFQSRHIHFIFHRRMHGSRNTKCSGGRVGVIRVDCAGNTRNCAGAIPPAATLVCVSHESKRAAVRRPARHVDCTLPPVKPHDVPRLAPRLRHQPQRHVAAAGMANGAAGVPV